MKSGTKNFLLKFVVPVVIIIALFKVKLLFGILAIILYFSYMLFTNRASVFAFLGARSYSKGDSDDAIRWFERAYQSGVAKPRIITAYAYMLLKLGDIEASEKILNEQMSKLLSAEDKMNVKSNMALVLWKKGQIDDALIMLKEVFEDYKTTTVYGSLGYFLILKGDLDKALEFNLEAYEYNNSNAVILDNLGQTYYLIGEYDKSEEIYKKLISSNTLS
jgi:tetratricopeptide (TPR) repeat protein